MRAASTAWTVSGTEKSFRGSPNDQPPLARASTPRPARLAISSSAKNGFPSARSGDQLRIAAGQLVPQQRTGQLLPLCWRQRLQPDHDAQGPAQPGR